MTIRLNWFRYIVMCGIALGINGASPAQTPRPDRDAAKQKTASQVAYFEAARVNASFEKAAQLVEGDTQNSHYKILTARRDKPGQSELHSKDTDLIYVLEGTARFVTGGEIVAGTTTAPDEIRGASIKDGTSRQLGKGDVILVPNGIPHQFVEVSNPFLYYVVKVR